MVVVMDVGVRVLDRSSRVSRSPSRRGSAPGIVNGTGGFVLHAERVKADTPLAQIVWKVSGFCSLCEAGSEKKLASPCRLPSR